LLPAVDAKSKPAVTLKEIYCMLLQGKDIHNKFTGNMSVHYQTKKQSKQNFKK